MGSLVVRANASEATPATNDSTHVAGNFGKGVISIQAAGVGTGTWGGTLNVAPVSLGGVLGTIKTYAITNAAPLAEDTLETGMSTFAAWWTNVTGTVALVGSVDG